ncbi:Uncharacterized protein HZ326_17871 [Fusarium oxysporum f. sp. albedinis]|nr:Uncharacterized protein HZ326_17871 [Fusarium oxysporum f. sp. albedinis]
MPHREPSTSCPRINRTPFLALMSHYPTAEALPLACNRHRETTFVTRPAVLPARTTCIQRLNAPRFLDDKLQYDCMIPP